MFMKKVSKGKNKWIGMMLAVLVGICTISNVNIQDEEVLNTSAEIGEEKIGWGIKRADNNLQPDLGSYNRGMIEKYEGMAMGGSESKSVYLTFDQGYEAGYTSDILNTLKENEVTATFFLTAHYINSQEELVKQMLEEDCIIGNHTVNHPSLPTITNAKIQEEIMNLHIVMQEKYDYEMKYMRPPMGEFSERSLEKTMQLGYTTVMWSFAYEDWDENNQPSIEFAKEKIVSNIHNGAIILLHGNSKTNTDVLDEVIKEIKSMGYEFKSLDEFER